MTFAGPVYAGNRNISNDAVTSRLSPDPPTARMAMSVREGMMDPPSARVSVGEPVVVWDVEMCRQIPDPNTLEAMARVTSCADC
jgi:hypothetical protein